LHEFQDIFTSLEYLRQVNSYLTYSRVQGTSHAKIWSLRGKAVSQFQSNHWICRLKRSAAYNRIQ